jgi:ABC-type transporter Mla subunit MlaD
MPLRPTLNNVLAGTFVVSSLALGVWVSFVLADKGVGGSGTPLDFSVRFSLSDGAAGIKPGSILQLGGQPIGRVIAVDFDRAAEKSNAPAGVLVRVEARGDVPLFSDATITLDRPLLGSLSSINIVNVGTKIDDPITTGEVVPGMLAPPAFLAQAGLGADQIAQLQRTLKNIDASVANVSSIIDRQGPNAEKAVADAQAMVTDLKGKVGQWTTSVDATLANIEKASGRIDPLFTQVEGGVADGRALIADARATITENRAAIDRIVKNVESATDRIDKKTLAELESAFTTGKEALLRAGEAVDSFGELLNEETPSIRRSLANVRVMSDQLKLTAIEVRSQPWRLIYQPDDKTLKVQTLYDGTRAYAQAASDVRSAAETLREITAEKNPNAAENKALEDATRALAESLAKYRLAEQTLMDALLKEQNKK